MEGGSSLHIIAGGLFVNRSPSADKRSAKEKLTGLIIGIISLLLIKLCKEKRKMKNLSMNFTSFKTDSQMLAEAVREAHKKSGTLIIPPVNPRTGESVYIIDETILLPSDMEIVLENCVLKLAPDARCNIFRNENMYKEGYLSKDSEQKNIFIRGIGNAVLDGEGHNDVFEWSSEKDGNPSVYCNNLLLFHNVDNFAVTGITVQNPRWWGLNFLFCSNGKISDIRIKTGELFSNQDGINLRTGCHDIEIARISGNSGDDFIALTAVSFRHIVEGKKTDIHDISIHDVIGSSVHEGIVTLRANDGHHIYNVDIENIIESNFDNENILPYGTILLGQRCFFTKELGKHGCMHHIRVSGVHTKSGGAAVTLCNTLCDSVIENIYAQNCINAVTTVNYDHYGNTRLVVRGNADDENFGPAGVMLERVEFKNINADKSVRGAAVDLSEMQDYDFLKDVTFSGIHSENEALLISDKIKKEGVKVR